MSWEDDIHMGNFSEIGESLRGMQETHSIGAAAQLRQLRGALGQLAGQRFAHHAPVSKQMRSPYKDSTQIGISATGTFTWDPQTEGSWSGSVLPQISGLTRVYKSFKPTKAILTEMVTTTFSNPSLGTRTQVASVTDASDLVLVQAFSGADNCFPNAPTESNGISGPTFANNSLGNGISWPTINGGIDMTVAFAVEESVVFRVTPPPGYTTDDIQQIRVKLRFNLLGPSLR
jgi:hypothetical protein